MNCPICKASVTIQSEKCDNCGRSLITYTKIIRISNTLYNRGLDKARIRDLSGAIEDLNLSLKYYKGNTDARNLLGLVYYEVGETVMALTQWILSKNLQPEGNIADEYINSIQHNASQLEIVNQTIKKYNAALSYARQGNDDLAIIQLKKVVSMNPRFVKAHQLLALLYMANDQKEAAVNVLKTIKRIDINNTITITYLKELGVKHVQAHKPAQPGQPERKVFHGDTGVAVKEVGTYKPEKPGIFPYVNILIGVIIGLFVGIVLIAPTIAGRTNKDKNNEIKQYGEKIAAQESTISGLEHEKEQLEARIAELEGLSTEQEGEADASLPLAQTYEKIIEAYRYCLLGDGKAALEMLSAIDVSVVQSETMKAIIADIQGQDAKLQSAEMFEKGRDKYNNGKYDKALEYLNKSLELNPDNYDAIYFLGRLYHRKGDAAKAEKYYKQVIKNYPNTGRAGEASRWLGELAQGL